VFLFAVSQVASLNPFLAASVFFILHVLVYPASNGYNSYMDRDETPVGGLRSPLLPTRELFYVTLAMDGLALILALLINQYFALGILLYIMASRAYSYRKIRLKRFPVIGFLTVFIFQGALVYLMVLMALQGHWPALSWDPLIASLLIGALYPLTQVYQHEADKADGVHTISMLLGKRGSFVFSMFLFLSATFLIFLRFNEMGALMNFYLFLIIMLPVVLFFLYWWREVWRDGSKADFINSLRMNIIATICTSAYFITLIVRQH